MRQEVFEVLHKWLKLEDEVGIDCIFATAVAAGVPGDPLWLFVIAPPGGTKTEIVRAFTGSYIYPVDSLTPQSLLSGFRSKDGSRADILEDLDGKLLVIKDFTAMLQKPVQTRDETFGRLRAAYDGTLAIAFGSGGRKQTRRATFGILAAVTPEIDNYATVHALLGERFLRIRNTGNRLESTRMAMHQIGRETEMRAEIAEIFRIALDYYKLRLKHGLPTMGKETENKILHLAEFIGILRTGVARNYRNEIIDKPEPEYATRLGKQLTRLGKTLFTMDCYSYEHLKRIARDSIRKTRLGIVMKLRNEGEKTTGELMKELKLPRHVVINVGDDLEALDAIEKFFDGNTFVHRLSDNMVNIMKEAEL